MVDLIFLNFAIVISYHSRYSVEEDGNLVYLIIYSNLAWLFLTLVSNPYAVSRNWTLSKIIRSQVVFLLTHIFILVSLVLFLGKSYGVYQMAVVYATFIPAFILSKVGILFLRKASASQTVCMFMIVGRNEVAYNVRRFFLINPEEQHRFVGFIDFGNEFMEDVRDFCEKHEVHKIFCCVPNVTEREMARLVDFGLNSLIEVKLVTSAIAPRALTLDEQEKMLAVQKAIIPLDEARYQLAKRVFDLVFSLLFIVLVLSWLVPLVAILIKIESKGPVFFIQKRNGRMNKAFGCIKFRTMVINAESDTKQATKDDNRVTRVGRFLRTSSIDEFPQFFNVLSGEMSIIGPRPHPLKLNEEYAGRIEELMSRHYVKPGITGLAQCMGYRGETKTLADMENRVRLDRYYIENWSFWLDIKIIFLTVVSLIRGSDKAY